MVDAVIDIDRVVDMRGIERLLVSIDAQLPLDQVEQQILSVARSPFHRYDNMLWVRGIKTYMDGGMLTGSAYMLQPWG